MVTTGWNCANGKVIDGLYKLVENINGKQAWKNSAGMYLKWNAMWNQWNFDDSTHDLHSVAWKSAGSTSEAPQKGSFTDFRYGTVCGRHKYVPKLDISDYSCNAGNVLYTFVITVQ